LLEIKIGWPSKRVPEQNAVGGEKLWSSAAEKFKNGSGGSSEKREKVQANSR